MNSHRATADTEGKRKRDCRESLFSLSAPWLCGSVANSLHKSIFKVLKQHKSATAHLDPVGGSFTDRANSFSILDPLSFPLLLSLSFNLVNYVIMYIIAPQSLHKAVITSIHRSRQVWPITNISKSSSMA